MTKNDGQEHQIANHPGCQSNQKENVTHYGHNAGARIDDTVAFNKVTVISESLELLHVSAWWCQQPALPQPLAAIALAKADLREPFHRAAQCA
jgi:hypothetical protein